MSHCSYENLSDLEPALSFIRSLEKIKERKPGIFYLKSRGFLHFHEKNGKRWADIRDGENWGSEVPISLNPDQEEIDAFIQEVRRRHQATLEA